VDVFRGFESDRIIERVRKHEYTLFMAVPTIYVKLLRLLQDMDASAAESLRQGFRTMRLMVSGSAALPETVFSAWERETGHRLLERYGMTEIGMALSNPLEGERRPGSVGLPLPGVSMRLWDTSAGREAAEGDPGEIQIQGANVFREYWRRDQATKESFQDGWFRTGDIGVMEEERVRILGRSSVDIIKSGGYKLSALEIEGKLLDHPQIRECAVVGVPDPTWGETVCAAVVTDGSSWDPDAMRDWCREKLSAYKIPRRWLVVDALPRNAMGKVTKPAVAELFSAEPGPL
jgi:malonyl-CoA/methylmalonyl-CoA synthetase